MAHEIEINDGIASFATDQIPAWHRLGQIAPGKMTVKQAIDLAHLGGWDVHLAPNYARETIITADGVTTVDLPTGGHATIRRNPFTGEPEVLGRSVSEDFAVIQNETTGEFLEALVDQSGGAFVSTAGSLRGGRDVFFCAQMPEGILVGGQDRIDLYLALLNGHDGGRSLTALVSPVRIVCANTQRAALNRAQQSWSIPHTKNAHRYVAEARTSLDLTFKYAGELQAEADRMIEAALTNGEFDAIAERVTDSIADPSDSPLVKRRKVARMDTLRHLFREAPTQKDIRGTKWAGYQAIGEFVDHHAGVFKKDRDVRRAASAVIGSGADVKAEAFRLLRVPA